MEWFILSCCYLLLSLFAYWSSYFNAVDFNFRIDHENIDDRNFWRFLVSSTRETWRLWSLDFLKIHCPWSKETSVKYRVQKARNLLSTMTHEKGWTVEDCDNPANHEQIAKDCFCSRTKFWLKDLAIMLILPIYIPLVLVVLILAMVATSIYRLFD